MIFLQRHILMRKRILPLARKAGKLHLAHGYYPLILGRVADPLINNSVILTGTVQVLWINADPPLFSFLKH